ncbi:unnamed protein product [Ascophyllum nodosum]
MDSGSDRDHALHQTNQRSIVEDEDRPYSGSLMESLPQMMYGYGDEEQPLPETVACMKELVSEYIRDVTDEACRVASMKGRLDTECYLFAVRRDRAKYKRGREILELNHHIKCCTRMRFTDQEMNAFAPIFRPQPRVRAVAKISEMSALSADETEEPLLSPSSSETSGSCLSSDSEGEAGK